MGNLLNHPSRLVTDRKDVVTSKQLLAAPVPELFSPIPSHHKGLLPSQRNKLEQIGNARIGIVERGHGASRQIRTIQKKSHPIGSNVPPRPCRITPPFALMEWYSTGWALEKDSFRLDILDYTIYTALQLFGSHVIYYLTIWRPNLTRLQISLDRWRFSGVSLYLCPPA